MDVRRKKSRQSKILLQECQHKSDRSLLSIWQRGMVFLFYQGLERDGERNNYYEIRLNNKWKYIF